MRAYGLLVAKYQDRVFNLLYRMLGRREDAEEIAQEAFLKALEKLPAFRGSSGFYTWLFRIATNLALSLRRRDGRLHFEPLQRTDEDWSRTQAEGLMAELAGRREPGPMASAMSAETQTRIAQALMELEDEMRAVVILRDIEEMDYAQIADVLEIPGGTVRSRLHRARMELREKLADLADRID
jgi:RNA polymerase sigma-70 factor (ECF subfamily)